jgi:soluble lytic murein transglycosylase-like protein
MIKINKMFVVCNFLIFGVLVVFYFLVGKYMEEVARELKITQTEITKVNAELSEIKKLIDQNAEKISFLDASMKPSDKMRAKIEIVRNIVRGDIDKKRYVSNLSNTDIYNLSSAVVRFSERYGISIALILSVIRQESSFNSKAVSRAGAQGLMQIMPLTAKECAMELNKKESEYDIFNVIDNVQFGVFYLSKMIYMFQKDISLAVKAYNAGPVFVKKFQSQEEGFLNLPGETVRYHENVMKYYLDYQERGL